MNRSTSQLLLLATLILASLALPARGDDWPQWRGTNREGVWRERGIVESFPTAGLPVRWRAPLGAGFSGPAVAQGKVFVMDRLLAEGAPQDVKTQWNYRDKTMGRERVVCLDEASGKPLWTQSYPCAYSIAYGSGPRATPTVSGDKVYTLGAMGDLLCLDVATGKILWQKNFVRDYGAEVPTYGYAGAPLVDGRRLIAVVGGEEHAVVAFDRETGRELWRSGSSSEPGYCAPIIRTLGGKRQLIVWHADGLVGIEPETGKVFWTIPHHPMAGMSISTPAVDGERLAVSSQYEGCMLLEFSRDTTVPKIVWKKTATGSVPEKQWKKAGFNTTFSTVLLSGGHVYGVSVYGETCCLDAADGRRVWTTLQPTSGGSEPHDRWCSAFFVSHGDKVFIFNERGDLILARLKPSGYEELARTHLLDPDMSSSGGGRKVIWSHPAFANRCVFVRNDHEIISVSLAAAKGNAGP
jgi:outer membrane protein assembly factor BamB